MGHPLIPHWLTFHAQKGQREQARPQLRLEIKHTVRHMPHLPNVHCTHMHARHSRTVPRNVSFLLDPFDLIQHSQTQVFSIRGHAPAHGTQPGHVLFLLLAPDSQPSYCTLDATYPTATAEAEKGLSVRKRKSMYGIRVILQ